MSFDFLDYDVTTWLIGALPYIALALFAAYMILGSVLDFHWRHYGVGIIKLFQLRAAYVSLGIILFGVLLVALFAL